MNPNNEIDFIQGLVLAVIVACVLSVTIVQTYKYGQRHPDPAKYCSYSSAVELAQEREAYGYERGTNGKGASQ